MTRTFALQPLRHRSLASICSVAASLAVSSLAWANATASATNLQEPSPSSAASFTDVSSSSENLNDEAHVDTLVTADDADRVDAEPLEADHVDAAPPEAVEAPMRRRAFEPKFAIDAELIGGLWMNPKESYSAFDLQRGELGVRFDANAYAGAELRIESFRSATPGSLVGLDGDSLALRVKRAQGVLRFENDVIRIQARLGITQDLWVEAVEATYDYRGLSPLFSESSGFFDTSDAGASLVVTSPDSLLGGNAFRLAASFTNGEGRNESERNAGKNFSMVASIQPVVAQVLNAPLRVGIHGMFRDGSLGSGSAANHRRAFAATVHHPRFELGWEWSKALGLDGDSDRDAAGHGVWAGGQIVDRWLGASARLDRLKRDLRLDSAKETQWTMALFSDFGTALPDADRSGGRVRLYAALQGTQQDALVAPIPGVSGVGDEFRVMFWVAVNGSATFPFF